MYHKSSNPRHGPGSQDPRNPETQLNGNKPGYPKVARWPIGDPDEGDSCNRGCLCLQCYVSLGILLLEFSSIHDLTDCFFGNVLPFAGAHGPVRLGLFNVRDGTGQWAGKAGNGGILTLSGRNSRMGQSRSVQDVNPWSIKLEPTRKGLANQWLPSKPAAQEPG